MRTEVRMSFGRREHSAAVLDLPSPVLFSERMTGLITCDSAQSRQPHRKICRGSKCWSLVTFCPWGLCEAENHAKSFLALASVTLWNLGSSAENPGKKEELSSEAWGEGEEAGWGTINLLGTLLSCSLLSLRSEVGNFLNALMTWIWERESYWWCFEK